jgi:hypothetical protein
MKSGRVKAKELRRSELEEKKGKTGIIQPKKEQLPLMEHGF